MPASSLDAADALFAAGRYVDAASAYARLTVRYGNHDALAVRRFIALVASNDCDQAAVVYEIAVANGSPITAAGLGTSGLAKLYGQHVGSRQIHVDSLALYAMNRQNDSTALSMVGTWLELDGQTQRAELFHARARMLEQDSKRVASTSDTPAHLVSTELAR